MLELLGQLATRCRRCARSTATNGRAPRHGFKRWLYGTRQCVRGRAGARDRVASRTRTRQTPDAAAREVLN